MLEVPLTLFLTVLHFEFTQSQLCYKLVFIDTINPQVSPQGTYLFFGFLHEGLFEGELIKKFFW